MFRRLGSRTSVFAVMAIAVIFGVPSVQGQDGPDLARAWAVLESGNDAAESAERLAEFDLSILDAVLRGERPPRPDDEEPKIVPPPSGVEREAVLAALRAKPLDDLDGWLRSKVSPGDDAVARILVVQLARDVGHPGLMDTVLDLIEPIDDVQLLRTFVAHSCRDALGGIVRAQPGSLDVLAKRWGELSRPLARIVADAALQAESGAAFHFLGGMLGHEEWRDLIALERIHVVARRLTTAPSGEALGNVRAGIRAKSSKIRMESLRALGELGDAESFRDVARRLDAQEPRIARVAAWSLKRISGENMRADRDGWLDWYDDQYQWHSLEWSELRSELHAFDEPTVLAALRGVCGRNLFRDEIAAEIVPLTRSGSVAVRESAVAVLQVLGSPRNLPVLVGALEDPEERVRRAAKRALRAITGETRSLAPEAWRKLLVLPEERS